MAIILNEINFNTSPITAETHPPTLATPMNFGAPFFNFIDIKKHPRARISPRYRIYSSYPYKSKN